MITLKWIIVLSLVFVLVGCATVRKDWEYAQTVNTVQSYQDFIRKHPQSEFSREAYNRIEKLDWQRTQATNTIDSYSRYLSHYQDGKFSSLAKERIDELEWKRAESEATVQAYLKFINDHPKSKFVSQAKLDIEKQEAKEWEKVNKNPSIEGYTDFLKLFPQTAAILGEVDERKKNRL